MWLFKSIYSVFCCCICHKSNDEVSNIFLEPSVHQVTSSLPEQSLALNDPKIDAFLQNVVDHFADETGDNNLPSSFESLSDSNTFWANIILYIVNHAKNTKTLKEFDLAIKRLQLLERASSSSSLQTSLEALDTIVPNLNFQVVREAIERYQESLASMLSFENCRREALTEERSTMTFNIIFSVINKFHWIFQLSVKSAVVQNDPITGCEDGENHLARLTFNEAMFLANILLESSATYQPKTQVQMSNFAPGLSSATNQLIESIDSLSRLLSLQKQPMLTEALRKLDENIKSEFRESLPFYALYLIKEGINQLRTTDDAANFVLTKYSSIKNFISECNILPLADENVQEVVLKHKR
jgi:hypothetical protein